MVSCCCFISSSKNLKVISLVLEFTNSSKVCEVSTRSASFLGRLEFRSSTSSTDYNKENKKKMWNWNQISSKTISVICIHIYNSLNSDFIAFEFHRISQRIRVLCKKFTIQNRIFCKSLAYVQLSFDLSSKLMFTLTELMYMVSGAIMSEKERVCVHKHHESLWPIFSTALPTFMFSKFVSK